MKKKIFISLATLIVPLLFIGCFSKSSTDKEKGNDKLKVTVSIQPLKEFTEIIGGDKVEVTSLVPNGGEPHDFEPKTKDLVELNKSQVFIYNGLGMEEWIDKVLESIDNKDLEIINSSNGVNKLMTDGKVDPHIWLSLQEAKVQTSNIKNGLIKVDPKNKDYYEKNYEEFKKQLDNTYNEYKDKFSDLKNKEFIAGHSAFGYLCRDFGLNQKSVGDLFGEGEITPQNLKELVDFCKENNIKTIFMPHLASPKVSETLANEVGAKVEAIYSLESKEDDLSYIEAMKINLDKILKSLNQ